MQEIQETQIRSLGWEDPLEGIAKDSVFSPGKSHGQRNLAGYSPRGHKESDMIEATENEHKYLGKW